jgi:hypothetical protein
MSSFRKTRVASMIKLGKAPGSDATSPEIGDSIVTAPFLSEIEIAMLELLEAGVDHWAAQSSRAVAERLLARGLVTLDEAPTLIDPPAVRYRITASGLQSLAAAKTLGQRPTHRRQIM